MTGLEPTWGSTGLLLTVARAAENGGRTDGSQAPSAAAVIHYAPAASVPRARALPFDALPPDAVLVFCLRVDSSRSVAQARRLLHKSMGQLRDRGIQEVYAFASPDGGSAEGDRCEFFSLGLLEDNGFQCIAENGGVFLMRADLRGLLGLLSQAETALRRLLRNDPTPSPAAWSRWEST